MPRFVVIPADPTAPLISEESARELRGIPPTRLEDEAAMEWLIRAARDRPKPHACCGDMEDAWAQALGRKARRLRGTGELYALNKLADKILATARTRA